jgi:hypothetical protein
MNDNHHTDIDQLLDDILFSRSGLEKLEEIIEEEKREQLKRDFTVHQAAASAVQRYHIFSQVDEIHRSHLAKRNGFTADDFPVRQHVTGRRNIIKRIWAAAAILIVVPALLYMVLVSSSSTDKLFNEKYHTYHFNVDRSSIATTSASTVIQAYRSGDYNSTVQQFKSKTSPDVSETMAAAFAYSELNQFQNAANLYESVIHNNVVNSTHLYQDEAEYYLALSFLKLRQYNKSYQLFNKIHVDSEHTYNGQVSRWFLLRLKWLK